MKKTAVLWGSFMNNVRRIRITFTSIALFGLLWLSCAALLADTVFAQTNMAEKRAEMQAAREDAAATRQDARANMQEQIQQKKDDRAANIEEFKADRAENIEAFKERRASTSADVEARKEQLKANREERQEQLKANREERKNALSDRVRDRVTKLGANISNRMDAVIARFEQIIDRAESRITKLGEETDVDISTAEGHIADAKASIAAAQAMLGNIDSEIEAVVSSESPRDNWKNARATFLEIKGHIKNAHASLRAAVTSIKRPAGERPTTAPATDTASST